MKRLISLLAVLCMVLTLTSCSQTDNQSYYEDAQLYLGCGEYETAARLFLQLGEYRDAADYALYCQALQAIADEEYALARTNLTLLGTFKSSQRYLTILDALLHEEDGELQDALALYESLGTFEGSQDQAERLRKEIPEAAVRQGRELMSQGDYAAARELFLSLEGYGQSAVLAKACQNAIDKAAYTAAEDLLAQGDTLGALTAFEAMGDTLDAAKRAQECLTQLLAELDEEYAAVTVQSANALIARYEALGESPEAAARIEALKTRYARNLDLLRMAELQPCVLYGSYPGSQSGVACELRWRVLRVEDQTAVLLCENVLDAADVATTTSLLNSDTPSDAWEGAVLPSASDLASLSDLTCPATPYALAQGITATGGYAVYWLRDQLESGIHPVISASGMLTLPTDADVPGIRPLLSVSLEDVIFTAGSGTPDDPFRTE